jgi:hypothetical protein
LRRQKIVESLCLFFGGFGFAKSSKKEAKALIPPFSAAKPPIFLRAFI